MGRDLERVQARLKSLHGYLVTLHGYNADAWIARRTGFFLSHNLIVIGLFSDDHGVTRTLAYDQEEKEISFEVLESNDVWDLHLARVESEHKPRGFLSAAATVPPNVGDLLRVLAPGGDTEFEFEGVREHSEDWGTVLRISCADHQDGAPLLNEEFELVGIARCRSVDGQQEQFGIPLAGLFSLLQGALQGQAEMLAATNPKIESLQDELTSTVHERDELKKKLAKQKEALDEKTASEVAHQKQAGRWLLENQRVKGLRLLGAAAVIGAVAFLTTVWPTIYRYDRLRTSPVRINRLTGNAEKLGNNGWEKMEADENVRYHHPPSTGRTQETHRQGELALREHLPRLVVQRKRLDCVWTCRHDYPSRRQWQHQVGAEVFPGHPGNLPILK